MKKILLANMTKRLEAVYDSEGDVLGGKSVNIIETDYNPLLLLAILNSQFMSKYYENRFHGKKLAGGYLQVSPAAVSQLPVPKSWDQATAKKLETLVQNLIETKRTAVQGTDGHERELADRTINSLELEVEKIVIKLYENAG
jgi:hypothetical protein